MSDQTQSDQTDDQQDGKTGDATGDNGGNQGANLLTQEQVDALIEKRLERAKKAWERDAKKTGDGENVDSIKAERDRLAKEVRDRDAKDSARDAAKKAGAPDPDLIYRVIRADLEFDDDGEPKNIKSLIDDLKQASPHLFRAQAGKADAGAGNGSKSAPTGMTALIRQAAGRG